MFINDCKALQDEIVKTRRDLHQIPEVGLDLPKTSAYVRAALEAMEIPYELSTKDSAIIATITGGQPGKTIALRADMDALPIQEATGLEFASKHDGFMHACGHDSHAAMLLGAAKVLKSHQAELKGNVRLIFQTAEELAKGAAVLCSQGVMKGVDAVFGLHIGAIISKEIPAGTFIVTPGPIMASYDRFVIKVNGVGCHGSTPEKGVDPVNIAAHIVIALETINAREFNACVPVVVTIGSIRGGDQYNIIPGQVVLEGTIRALDENVRQKVAKRIEEISVATATAFGGNVEFEMDWGAPPVVNDEAMTALAVECAQAVVGVENVITHVDYPNMGGEDFAYYLQEVPGAFLHLSSVNPAKGTDVAHHNAKFDVDEDVFWMGSAVFAAITEKFLNE